MMENLTKLLTILGAEKVKFDEPLSLHTSIKTGGPAKLYFIAQSKDDLVNSIKASTELKIPYFVLGGGTNVLFKDSGFDGLVIRNKAQNISLLGFKGKIEKGQLNLNEIIVEAQSGATINQLVRYTLEENLEGLEYFLGQPGTVGGAVYINAHWPKKGLFIGDNVMTAQIITLHGIVKEVKSDYFRFGYDKSVLPKSRDVVLSVKFRLKKGNKDLLWQRGNETLSYRKETQPNFPSLGCTFQNINKSDAIRLATPNLTCSAGYLIDSCGLKGKTIGGAQVSQKHANFILNTGNATSSDILSLIKLIKSRVVEKFGVELKEEIVLV